VFTTIYLLRRNARQDRAGVDQQVHAKREHADQIKVRHRHLEWDGTGLQKCCTCNNSELPIHDVRAGIRGESGKYIEATEVSEPKPNGVDVRCLNDGDRLKWLNAGFYCIFRFPVKKADVHDPDVAVRYIDYNGNPWQQREGYAPIPLVEDDWPE
jgi:hypothetical protein